MKINKFFATIFLTFNLLVLTFLNHSSAKTNETPDPSCSMVGEIQCPKGYNPNCPKQYKPACIFVGTMHLPSCLADSADNTFFSYALDKISCQKSK